MECLSTLRGAAIIRGVEEVDGDRGDLVGYKDIMALSAFISVCSQLVDVLGENRNSSVETRETRIVFLFIGYIL